MTRSYRAARRARERAGVPFDYAYIDVEEERDEAGELLGETEVERKTTFTCRGRVNTLLLSELAYNADLDTADPQAMALIREFFAQAFGVRYRTVMDKVKDPVTGEETEVPRQVAVEDESFREYRRFFKLHGQYGDDDLLMDIMGGLMEDMSGRPTEGPSPSPAGESTTGPVSKVVSFSRRSVEVVEGEVLPQEEGRALSS